MIYKLNADITNLMKNSKFIPSTTEDLEKIINLSNDDIGMRIYFKIYKDWYKKAYPNYDNDGIEILYTLCKDAYRYYCCLSDYVKETQPFVDTLAKLKAVNNIDNYNSLNPMYLFDLLHDVFSPKEKDEDKDKVKKKSKGIKLVANTLSKELTQADITKLYNAYIEFFSNFFSVIHNLEYKILELNKPSWDGIVFGKNDLNDVYEECATALAKTTDNGSSALDQNQSSRSNPALAKTTDNGSSALAQTTDNGSLVLAKNQSSRGNPALAQLPTHFTIKGPKLLLVSFCSDTSKMFFSSQKMISAMVFKTDTNYGFDDRSFGFMYDNNEENIVAMSYEDIFSSVKALTTLPEIYDVILKGLPIISLDYKLVSVPLDLLSFYNLDELLAKTVKYNEILLKPRTKTYGIFVWEERLGNCFSQVCSLCTVMQLPLFICKKDGNLVVLGWRDIFSQAKQYLESK